MHEGVQSWPERREDIAHDLVRAMARRMRLFRSCIIAHRASDSAGLQAKELGMTESQQMRVADYVVDHLT